jgi:nifR3 family TIM-barrel protein
MVSAKAICYRDKKTAPLARIGEDEGPTAVQIFGSDPTFMAEAARMIEDGFAGGVKPIAIDINMGCPVHKIVSNGEGSALLKQPLLVEKIVSAVCAAVSLPVSVKIRAGWDADHLNAPEVARACEAGGASLLTVHGRTRVQMYAGEADYGIIEEVARAVSVPVVGNGDIFCAEDAKRMFEQTECDGIMVARGAQGNPWIFAELQAAAEGREYTPPTAEERFAVALEHAHGLVEDKGERVGIAESRKHLSWYLHGVRGAAAARNAIMQASSMQEIEQIVKDLRDSAHFL